MAIKPVVETDGEVIVSETSNSSVSSEIVPVENNDNSFLLNVDAAVEQWEQYQDLCRRILDESDYQQITVKEKDPETGKYVPVKRKFRKKSGWFKIGRAFNIDTEIVEREDFRHPKTHRVVESYYQVRATLPNGRSVVADASCDKYEKGKTNASAHDLRTTAETRATNRAVAKLVGAGEVSAEELKDE